MTVLTYNLEAFCGIQPMLLSAIPPSICFTIHLLLSPLFTDNLANQRGFCASSKNVVNAEKLSQAQRDCGMIHMIQDAIRKVRKWSLAVPTTESWGGGGGELILFIC